MKYIITVLTLTLIAFNAYSVKEDCHNLAGPGVQPTIKIGNGRNMPGQFDWMGLPRIYAPEQPVARFLLFVYWGHQTVLDVGRNRAANTASH